MNMVLFYDLLFSLGLAVMCRNVKHLQFSDLDSYLGSVELECADKIDFLELPVTKPRDQQRLFFCLLVCFFLFFTGEREKKNLESSRMSKCGNTETAEVKSKEWNPWITHLKTFSTRKKNEGKMKES